VIKLPDSNLPIEFNGSPGEELHGTAQNPDVWNVQRVLLWSATWLKAKATDLYGHPKLEAELLLAQVLELDRMNLYLQLDRPLSKSERESYKGLLRRRVEGEPVAYILGYRDFYRHRFVVSPAVLIPRPDTELLVELASRAATTMVAPRILDIGTGSGCVAISLASEVKTASVVAWEISSEALAVANRNMQDIGVTNLTMIQRDALAKGVFEGDLYDIIVSNPPYIAKHEVAIMSRETLNFEPKIALFSADDEGMAFYQIFAKHSQVALREGGKLFLEIGLNQAAKVAQLLKDANWAKIEVVKDLSGHDRVICAERP
jgi:release factor glutamine methyltransferase